MFEAYSRNKYTSTGVIQWMLNNAWPSMIWHLYDYYLRPAADTSAPRRPWSRCIPSMATTTTRSGGQQPVRRRERSEAYDPKCLNLDMSEKFSRRRARCSSRQHQKILTLPDVDGLSADYFLVFALEDCCRQTCRIEFLLALHQTRNPRLGQSPTGTPRRPRHTPTYTALSQLPKVKLKVSRPQRAQRRRGITHVTAGKPKQEPGVFCTPESRIRAKAEKKFLPVIWQDNYISLLPGEKREISATYRAAELGAAKPAVEVSGWNVE